MTLAVPALIENAAAPPPEIAPAFMTREPVFAPVSATPDAAVALEMVAETLSKVSARADALSVIAAAFVVVIVPLVAVIVLLAAARAATPESGEMSRSAKTTPPLLVARLTPVPPDCVTFVLAKVTSVVEF